MWADISLDFIEDLSKEHDKSVIFTMVLQIRAFHRARPPYMATSVACAFFDGIVRLHEFPTSIVSDWDPVFTSHLRRDLFKMAGV